MSKQNKSSFRGTVTENIRERERSSRSNYLTLPEGIKLLSIPEKTLQLSMDFLPYIVTMDNHPDRNEKRNVALKGYQWYKLPIKIHRNVGVTNVTIICPTTVGQRCPICEHVAQQSKAKKLTKDDYKELSAKNRTLYIVIPLGNKDLEEVPYIWDVSDHLFQKILKTELEIDERNDIFPDLEEGKTLDIKFIWETSGEGSNPFPKARNINFRDRAPYDAKALEIIHLDDVLNILTYDEIHTKFWEADVEQPAEEIVETTDVTQRESPFKASSLRKTTDPLATEDKSSQSAGGGGSNSDDKKDQTTTSQRQSSRQRQAAAATGTTEVKDKCPSGHVFGVDTAQFKECDTCTLWDACDETNLAATKK